MKKQALQRRLTGGESRAAINVAQPRYVILHSATQTGRRLMELELGGIASRESRMKYFEQRVVADETKREGLPALFMFFPAD